MGFSEKLSDLTDLTDSLTLRVAASRPYFRGIMNTAKKKTVFRYDKGTIEPIERVDGFLRARVSIARDGVFPYLTPSGTIRMEAKLPEDIFSELTIETAKGVPVTDGHPPIDDNKGLISPENYSRYVKGALGDSVSVQNGHLQAVETIFDAGLMTDLKAGRKLEVSIGFITDMDDTPGEYAGQRYDARQTNIRINHVAHVDQGRGGDTVRAHLDAAVHSHMDIAVMKTDTNAAHKNTDTRGEEMDENAILAALKKFFTWIVKGGDDEGAQKGDPDTSGSGSDGPDSTGSGQAAPDPEKEPKKDQADAVVKKMQARIDALEALIAQKDKSGKAKQDAARIDAAIQERMGLVDAARSVIPDFKYDGMLNRDIKLAVIDKVLPFEKETKVDALEDVFIDARYDAALSLAREKASLDEGTSTSPRIDEAEIAKKRASRLDVMNMQ